MLLHFVSCCKMVKTSPPNKNR